MSEPAKVAVIDLGSNSFRLVVFSYAEPDETGRAWWRRTDEIHEAVRIAAGQDEDGTLAEEPMERALETLELYAHFCRATGVEDVRPVATSAIRDAANQGAFLHAARERTGPRGPRAHARGGGPLRLPGGRQLDHAGRRRRARPRRRLDAAHARRQPARDRRALLAAGRRAHDGALPARRARQGQAGQGAARARRRAAGGGRLAGARRAARGRRRHGAQPRLGRGDRGRAALLRRPGLLGHARRARRARRDGSPSCPPPSARRCRGSRRRAAT